MSNELIVIKDEKALELFTSGNVDPIIAEAKKIVDGFKHDLSTGVSRAKTASLASGVSKFKVKIDGLRKDLVADWKAKSKAVDESGKKIRDALDELKIKARKPLTDWENEEKERVIAITEKIEAIKNLSHDLLINPDPSMSELQMAKTILETITVDSSFEEYEFEATKEYAKSTDALKVLIEKKQEALEQAAELRRLKEEQEVRDKKDHEDEIKRIAAKEAEDKIIEDNRIANEKIEKDKQDAIEAKEKAELDAEIAEQRRLDAIELSDKKVADAIAEEKQKLKDKEDAEKAAVSKREADREHTGKIRKAAKESLMQYVDEAAAKKIVLAIDQGRITHVSINY